MMVLQENKMIKKKVVKTVANKCIAGLLRDLDLPGSDILSFKL